MPEATRAQVYTAAASSAGSNQGSSALALASIATSEQLVKTLRVPQPPPNGVSKIDIALEAWQSDSFFVPKKADLLSQWVLEYLCSSLKASASTSAPATPNKGKNKGKQHSQKQQTTSDSAAELDLKAWSLLSSIVTAQATAQADLSEAAKRSWLSHLANTQSVLALAGSFARKLDQHQPSSEAQREKLLLSASAALEKLLPLATSRTAATNIEAATDSIQAWLDFFAQPRSEIETQIASDILQATVKPWITALQYGSNAKRNHQHFCSQAVPSLLRALHALGNQQIEGDSDITQSSALIDNVQRIAAESLFADDVQRVFLQAGRQAQVSATPTWKQREAAATGVIAQLLGFMQDQQLAPAVLTSLPILSDLLYAKLHRSEMLNSVISFSNTTAGTVREAQLSLVRKTMLSEWLYPLLPHLLTCSDVESLRKARAAARRGILQSIERNSLYIVGSEEQEEWQSLYVALFDSVRHELREVVTATEAAAQLEAADHFSCLTSLWQLEKAVVEPELVSIFGMIAAQRVSKEALWLPETLPAATLAALDLFRAVAALDARFRTIPNLVHAILGSLPLAAELLDESLSSSLFTSQTFLAELGKLCRDSVTPMQVSDLLHRLTSLSQSFNTVLENITSAQVAKRQRTSQSSSSKTDSIEAGGAAALTAQLQIAAQVLQSVSLAPTLRARSIAAAQELHNTLILPCIDACLSSGRGPPSSAVGGVAAAALRARQALLSEKWRYDPSEPVKLDGSLPTEGLDCLETAFDERADSLIELLAVEDDLPHLCQLQFQIMQSLLQRAERDTFLGLKESRYCHLLVDDAGVVRSLVGRIQSTAQSSAGGAWNGCPDRVRTQAELMQVLWMAVLTRWAPLFDAVADLQIVQGLAHTLVRTAQPSLRQDDVQSGLRYITSTALRNASFLELPNWRKHVTAAIQHGLAKEADLEHRLASAAPLWAIPIEWVSRSARGPLLQALLMLDRDVVTAQQERKTDVTSLVAAWTELRALIARVNVAYATDTGVSEDDLFLSLQAFLSLHEFGAMDAHLQQSWERATLAAINATVRALLARSKPIPSISQRLLTFAQQLRQDAEAELETNDTKIRITLTMRAAQEMLTALSSLASFEAKQQGRAGSARANVEAITKLSSASLDGLSGVVQTLDASLYHLREVRLLVGGDRANGADNLDLALLLSSDVVRSLCTLFSRTNALVTADADARQKVLRSAADVALELLRCIDSCGGVSTGHDTALGACLAYSASIASLPGLQEQRRLAEDLQRVISRLQAEQYDAVLCKLLSAMRSTASATTADAAALDGDQAALSSTIGLVLGSAPEGTSKIARSHLSNWLAILNTSEATSSRGRIKLRSIVASISALDLLCSNHVMLLRTQEMGSVMQLFSTLTGPSMADSPSPTLNELPRSELDTIRTKIFDGIVSTLNSLMRLRQDLVLGFLPQLGLLLARLCTLFRQLRSSSPGRLEGSGMQRRSLRRELPGWLDPVLVSPLDVHEARSLSRLLSNLVVKNVSLKARSSTSSNAKAESLARPFAKHATYVLVAYLRSLTTQGAVVPARVREELEVGMMTVCEVVGVRQRDAAMTGLLDSAGKVLMKRLWGVYEKQRYKGQ